MSEMELFNLYLFCKSYIFTIKGDSRRAEKKLHGADEDEGCQTAVGRSRSREETGLEQKQGRCRNRAGAEQAG